MAPVFRHEPVAGLEMWSAVDGVGMVWDGTHFGWKTSDGFGDGKQYIWENNMKKWIQFGDGEKKHMWITDVIISDGFGMEKH